MNGEIMTPTGTIWKLHIGYMG